MVMDSGVNPKSSLGSCHREGNLQSLPKAQDRISTFVPLLSTSSLPGPARLTRAKVELLAEIAVALDEEGVGILLFRALLPLASLTGQKKKSEQ
jgi:hypothetical protein